MASKVPAGVKVPRWISLKTSLCSSVPGPRERGAMTARSTTSLGPWTPSGCPREAGSGRSRPSGNRYRYRAPGRTPSTVAEKYPSPSAFRAAVGPSTTRTDSALVRGAHTRKVVALFEGTAPSQGCHVTGRNLRTARLAENAGTDALPLSRPCSLPASARFLAYLPLPRCFSGLPSGMHGPRTSVTVGRCVAPGSTSPCSR